jgi:DMSO/TMAO reductase YedYZ molybdopterin-dependent catalytic subunit
MVDVLTTPTAAMRVPAGAAALAGGGATLLGVGVGELLGRVLPGGASPLDALGGQLVGRLPGGAITLAIEALGTANRPVLTGVSVAVAVAIGAATGVAARRTWTAAAAVFTAAAALALLALGAQTGTAFPIALLIVAGALTAALTALWFALDRAVVTEGAPDGPRPAASPTDPPVRRRDFLGVVGGSAVAGVALGAIGRLGTGSTAAAPATTIALPPAATAAGALPVGADPGAEIDGLSPLFTPNDDFFRIDTAIAVPRVDAGSWRLSIHGLVERELKFDLDTLLARDLVEVDATIACVSNEVGGGLIGNARWLGVPLVELLEEAGPTAAAQQVLGRSVDGWTGGFPLELVGDGRQAILALGMNGEPLPVRHGFPARLIVPGLYGYVSATKWIESIELTPWEGVDGYWVPRGWSKQGPVKTSARIDVPAQSASVPAGPVVVAGMAWAPPGGISGVEVRVDDAGSWSEADLAPTSSGAMWRPWRRTVELEPGTHRLEVRAVDADGGVQREGPRPPAPDGAEGWHTITVEAV